MRVARSPSRNVPSPRCPRDGVKVKVEAAALNFADLLMVQG
jgi:NADPH:quinone reductase-like Zn-dependent oxidoreductase